MLLPLRGHHPPGSRSHAESYASSAALHSFSFRRHHVIAPHSLPLPSRRVSTVSIVTPRLFLLSYRVLPPPPLL
ncbi:uncharacterized protein DS421_11g334600 [Arachis hypogaea]|nr:uncharacterized protein DS421_11g334600 [Arachis hypogaea]